MVSLQGTPPKESTLNITIVNDPTTKPNANKENHKRSIAKVGVKTKPKFVKTKKLCARIKGSKNKTPLFLSPLDFSDNATKQVSKDINSWIEQFLARN